MIEGIMWAIAAGVMLGLYALPEKYTRGFEYENTWGLFFLVTMFVVPFIAAYLLLDGLKIFTLIHTDVLVKMAVASLLWGVGIIMWGKAINHIGLSLGFSIFIGTLIFIGSLIPWFVDSAGKFTVNLPSLNVLFTIRNIFLLLSYYILNETCANGEHNLLAEYLRNKVLKELT